MTLILKAIALIGWICLFLIVRRGRIPEADFMMCITLLLGLMVLITVIGF